MAISPGKPLISDFIGLTLRNGCLGQAFIRMGEQVNGALKPRADGTKPLDDVIDGLANDVSVSYFLLPTPAAKEVEKPPKDPKKLPKILRSKSLPK